MGIEPKDLVLNSRVCNYLTNEAVKVIQKKINIVTTTTVRSKSKSKFFMSHRPAWALIKRREKRKKNGAQ